MFKLFITLAWLLTFSCLGLAQLNSYIPTKPIHLVTFEVGNNAPRNHFLPEVIVRKALARHNYSLELEYMPATRATVQANNGLVDGELIRPVNVSLDKTGTLPVPEPVCQVSYYLYSLHSYSSSNHWIDLPNPHLILLPSLANLIQHLPEQDFAARSPIMIQGVSQGLRELAQGKGNALLMAEGLVERTPQAEQRKAKNIIKLQPAVTSQPGYLWLNHRYEPEISALATALQQVKQELKEQLDLPAEKEINCYELISEDEVRVFIGF